MLEQHCQSCGDEFNYQDKTATVICSKKHVLCKMCAQELEISKKKCPVCGGQTTLSNPYGGRESVQGAPSATNQGLLGNNQGAWNGYSNPSHQQISHQNNVQYPALNYQQYPGQQGNQGYQGYQNQGSQGYQNQGSQGFQLNPGNHAPNTYHQVYHPQNHLVSHNQLNNYNQPSANPLIRDQSAQAAQGKPKLFENVKFLAILLTFSVVGFCVVLGIRISMESCSYWSASLCFYGEVGYECCDYACPTYWYDNSCHDVSFYQISAVVGTVTATLAFFGPMVFISLILLIRAQRINKRRALANAQVYTRI